MPNFFLKISNEKFHRKITTLCGILRLNFDQNGMRNVLKQITTKAFSRSIFARFEWNLRGKKWLNHTQSGLTKYVLCRILFGFWICFCRMMFIDDVFQFTNKIYNVWYTVPAALSWVKTMWPSSDLFRNWYLLERNTACFLRTP